MYVGVTKHSSLRRFEQHVYAAYNRKSHYRIHQAIRKYGKENFSYCELCSILDSKNKEDILNMESFFITHYNTHHGGYNSNPGGYGLLYHTNETKQKMSLNNHWRDSKRIGKLNPMFGKKHSAEVKKKISEKNVGNRPRLGAVLTEETRNKISEALKGRPGINLGKKWSAETKEKMSLAKRGKVSYTKTYKITYPNGHVEIVHNRAKFCRINKLSEGNLSTYGKTKGFSCQLISE